MPRAFTPAQIRRQGRLLDKARFEYASSDERELYDLSLAERRDPTQEFPNLSSSDRGSATGALLVFANTLSGPSFRQRLRESYQERLVIAMVEEREAVYGEPIEPVVSSTPKRLPLHHLVGASIDWDASCLTHGSFVYGNVRVVPMRDLKAKTGKSKGGRPTMRLKVWASMRIAQHRDSQFRRKSKAQQCYAAYKVIREFKGEWVDEQAGLSDSAMMRHVNSYWARERKRAA